MAGWKHWAVGDALTAADLNGFLSSQVVPRFSTVANRNSAIASPTDGQMAYTSDFGELYRYSSANGGSWVGAVPRVKFKSTTKNIASNVTLAADTDFNISLEASSYYVLEFAMFMVGADSTADFKADVTYSGTTNGTPSWAGLWLDTTNTASDPTNMHLDNVVMIGTPITIGCISANQTFWMGSARFNTTTTGSFAFRWSQNTTSTNAVSLLAGSWMSFLKVK